MADTTIDLLKNSSYVGKMDELIAAVKSGGGTASDVEWDNVKNKPTTIVGYGITDAKIENGTITLGNQTITPLTSAPVTSVNSKTGVVVLTANDVGALPNTTTIPDKTSQLDNDSGYITNSALTDYAKKTEIPDKLPNPNALTFTGAVEGSYDGSAPLEVLIPSGGGGGGNSNWETIFDTTLEESAALNTGEIPGKTEMMFLFATPKCDANLSLAASSKTFGASLNGFAIGSGTYGKVGCIYCMKINGNGIPFIGSSDTTSTTPDIGTTARTNTTMSLGKPTPSADDIPLKLTSELPIGTKIKVFVR